MKGTVEKLVQFSERFDLWSTALNDGKEALGKCFAKRQGEANELFPQQAFESIQFVRKNQKLTFVSENDNGFVLSTTFSLFLVEDAQRTFEIGYYTSDVDEDGKFIDDWLVIF